MYELRRLKRYGFVSCGKFISDEMALKRLAVLTFIKHYNWDTFRFNGEDGFTYEIKYV